MGIPSYFAHLVRRHRTIIRKYTKNDMPIDNLYLDCNSFVYDAVRDTKFSTQNKNYEEQIIQYVGDKLSEYILLLAPQKKVFIAFDGVAPVAKMNQQRKRRYMSWFQQRMNLEEGSLPVESWNTAAITPGTAFMTELTRRINERFTLNWPGKEEIIVSAADEAGEGEHKIYEYIRQHPSYHKNTLTVIYGLDADLIMLTLNHLHIADKLYLFRETPHFIQSLDKTLDANELYLLDIPKFGMAIIEELGAKPKADAGADTNTNADANMFVDNRLFDYIFLCFLLGNDFLPHFPALSIRTTGIDRILGAYKHLFLTNGLSLTQHKGRDIVWKNVRILVAFLGQHEHEYILEEYKGRERQSSNIQQGRRPPNGSQDKNKNKNKNKDKEDPNLLLPMKDRSVEIFINPQKSGWENRYYRELFDINELNEERLKEVCVNYLEGLEWTLAYYTSGCTDWRWTYKYDYPPLLADLIKYVPFFNTQFIAVKPKNPVRPLVQLSYVLSENSYNLLPPIVSETLQLYIKNTPELFNESTYTFKWAFCKYFWEAHVGLPEIHLSEIERMV